MTLEKRRLDYKWVIIAACFVMQFISLGFCSSTKSLYLSAITEALNLERSLFSISDSCRYIATSIINLFFGALVLKLGVRKMTAIGMLTLFASCMVNAYATSIYHFYIAGALLGAGLTFVGTTMGSYIVKQWCTTNVGRYTGIVLAANGLGGAVATQILSPMIFAEGNPFGYQDSYRFAAWVILGVGVVLTLLIRDNPNKNQSVVPGGKKKPRGATWVGIEYDKVKKRGYFYVAAVCVFLTGMILQGINGIRVAYMKDVGVNVELVTNVISLSSLVLMGSKLLVGVLYDRKGLGTIMIMCQVATILSFLCMIFLNDSAFGSVLAVIGGVMFSIGIPLETIAVSLITNELFGSASYEKLLGIMMALTTAGFALGSPVTNLCFDAVGSYIPVFWLFCGLMAAIMVVFQFVIKAAQKEKAAILLALEQSTPETV